MLLRIFLMLLLSVIIFSLPVYYFWYKPKFTPTSKAYVNPIEDLSPEFTRLKMKALTIKEFAAAHNLNSEICFLVDMSIESGKNRFFVYDVQVDSVMTSGLVAHGSCDDGYQFNARFSNVANSGCSCLGKFRIGKAYNGNFGLAYKLYGLDSSNSNAFKRNIVLHSYNCVPEQETFPIPVCNSRGCPMISPGFMKQLRSIISLEKKPLVLLIFH